MFGDTRRATGFVDLSRWPPEPVVNRTEYAVSFDVLPDGRVVVCSMPTRPAGEYAIRIHPADWPANLGAGTLEEHPSPGGMTTAEVWCVSGRVVAFDWLIEKGKPPGTHRAYLLDRGKFVPAPGLPPVTAFGPDTFGHQVHTNGKVTLATGEEVLLWDGDGYSWGRNQFELTWKLGSKEPGGIDGWTSVPWGEDGFFYLSGRKLTHARRGQRPTRLHPDLDNVFSLSPAPEDSVILCMGQNAKRHVARVWFPSEGTYIPIFRGNLRWGPSATGGSLYWSADTRHVHISPLWTFPDADLLGLDRVRPRGKGYLVPKE